MNLKKYIFKILYNISNKNTLPKNMTTYYPSYSKNVRRVSFLHKDILYNKMFNSASVSF